MSKKKKPKHIIGTRPVEKWHSETWSGAWAGLPGSSRFTTLPESTKEKIRIYNGFITREHVITGPLTKEHIDIAMEAINFTPIYQPDPYKQAFLDFYRKHTRRLHDPDMVDLFKEILAE